MARVLIVGIEPDQVDYADPALPAGLDANVIREGVTRGINALRTLGHDAQHFYIPADPAGVGGLGKCLAEYPVDCVVLGGGMRLPPRNLPLFEAVLNTVARAVPPPAIALIARPEETAVAVTRVLG